MEMSSAALTPLYPDPSLLGDNLVSPLLPRLGLEMAVTEMWHCYGHRHCQTKSRRCMMFLLRVWITLVRTSLFGPAKVDWEFIRTQPSLAVVTTCLILAVAVAVQK